MSFDYLSWKFIVGVFFVIWSFVEIFKRRTVDFITFTFVFDASSRPLLYFIVLVSKIVVGVILIMQTQILDEWY